jgi:hypothetical protein
MGLPRVAAVALFAGWLAGCDKGPAQTATPTTVPSTPIMQMPQTQPVTVWVLDATQPVTDVSAAAISIGQKEFWFPQAVLRLESSRGRVNARLSSDDPPEAIQDNYHGNSFDLIMSLPISEAGQIDQATWNYATAATPQDESPHGIFLDGQRRRLHPENASATFQRDGDKVVVLLNGWFLMYDTTGMERAAPMRVFVQGRLEATVAAK